MKIELFQKSDALRRALTIACTSAKSSLADVYKQVVWPLQTEGLNAYDVFLKGVVYITFEYHHG